MYNSNMIRFRSIFSLPQQKDILFFEQKAKISLPEDYKLFLLEQNGGIAENFYPKSVFTQEVQDISPLFGIHVTSLYQGGSTQNYAKDIDKSSDLAYQYHSLQLIYDHPESVILIASSLISYVLMSLEPEHYGRIYCGHPHEGEEQLYDEERAESTSVDEELAYVGFRPFANNFTEFLNSSVSKAEYRAYLKS